MVGENMSFEEFRDGLKGGRLRYWKRNGISNSDSPCLTEASEAKFQLSQTSDLESIFFFI